MCSVSEIIHIWKRNFSLFTAMKLFATCSLCILNTNIWIKLLVVACHLIPFPLLHEKQIIYYDKQNQKLQVLWARSFSACTIAFLSDCGKGPPILLCGIFPS